jgi:hypothetical protein
MKRRLNREVVLSWKESVGGHSEATRLVIDRLKCSTSKADKVASGHYPSIPSALERQALSDLMGVQESELFPPARGKSRAS